MLQAAFITRRTLLQSCCATRPSAPPALHTSAPLEKLYTAWRWTPWPRCFKTMKSRRASIWLWRKSRFPVRYLYRRPGSYEGCVDGVGLGARGRQAFTAPLTPLRSINKTNPFTVASNARWPGRPLSTLASLRRLSTLQMLGNRFAEFSQRTQQRVCDFFGVLGRLAARQFEVYLAQKTRRAVQLSQLYSVVYVWTVFESVVRLHAASLFRRASELAHRSRGKLFGLAAAVLATAECSAEDTISDAEMKRFVDEVTDELPAKPVPLFHVAFCLAGCDEFDDGPAWRQLLDEPHCGVWSRDAPECNQIEYKVMGNFEDVSAWDFFQTQLDVDYRKEWDNLTQELELVDTDESADVDVLRWVLRYPYPLNSREYVFLRKARVDWDRNVIVLVSKAAGHTSSLPMLNDKETATAGHVPVRNYASVMAIRPWNSFEENGMEFVLTYVDDFGSPIPRRFSDWIVGSGIPEFYRKLHAAAKQKAISRQTGGRATPIKSVGSANLSSNGPVHCSCGSELPFV